jgi:Protein of unknown function (DUF3102)
MSVNLSNRLPGLAEEIRSHVIASRNAARTTLASAIAAGEALIEAKGLVEHGGWLPWLKEHVDIGERQAQNYMRLAKRREKIEAKSALTSDLTISAVISELTRPTSFVPPDGHIKVGIREDDESIDEIWIAPSQFYPSHVFVVHIQTSKENAASLVTSARKPVRIDYAAAMVHAMADDEAADFTWRDYEFPAWTYNIILDDEPLAGAELSDLLAWARGRTPPLNDDEFPQHLKQPMKGSSAPLVSLVFGEAQQELIRGIVGMAKRTMSSMDGRPE